MITKDRLFPEDIEKVAFVKKLAEAVSLSDDAAYSMNGFDDKV